MSMYIQLRPLWAWSASLNDQDLHCLHMPGKSFFHDMAHRVYFASQLQYMGCISVMNFNSFMSKVSEKGFWQTV